MEKIGTSIKGIYRDILRGPKGNLIYDSGWVHNTIVESCRVLLARLMSNTASNGIQFLAVGYGEPDWDSDGIPEIEVTTDDLVNRFTDTPIRVNASDFVYLNEAGAVVTGPTSRLQVTATLGPGYPAPLPGPLNTAPLREFGLFSTDGYMINGVRHAVIHKDVSATLVRVIRLYF